MKKRLLLSLCLVWIAGMSVAQVAADSVRVRVETSSGANIGLDGEVSSTNILTEKVAVGAHKVVVQYGATFVREYDIEVKVDGQHTFSFPLDGRLKVSSVPAGATVYVDGISMGSTPAELKLLGEHNLRVVQDPEVYYETTERVHVAPFEELTRSYTLKKRPPRLYGMVMANWTTSGVGGFVGMCRRFGAYARFASSVNGLGFGKLSPRSATDVIDYGPGYYHKDDSFYGQVTGGVLVRCHKYLYAYAGAGYGEYAQGYVADPDYDYYDRPDICPYGSKGCAVDVGVIFKWKALLLSGGYSTIVGSNYPGGTRHNEFTLGIGFTIHKKNKQ